MTVGFGKGEKMNMGAKFPSFPESHFLFLIKIFSLSLPGSVWASLVFAGILRCREGANMSLGSLWMPGAGCKGFPKAGWQ